LFPCWRHRLLRPCSARNMATPLSTTASFGIGNSATRQVGRVLSSSRRGYCFLEDGLGLSLGCRLAACSGPRRLVLLGNNQCGVGQRRDDGACGNDILGRLSLQRITVRGSTSLGPLVRYNVGRRRKRLTLILWLGGSGFAHGQSNEVMST
jgi:hypothetical protein